VEEAVLEGFDRAGGDARGCLPDRARATAGAASERRFRRIRTAGTPGPDLQRLIRDRAPFSVTPSRVLHRRSCCPSEEPVLHGQSVSRPLRRKLGLALAVVGVAAAAPSLITAQPGAVESQRAQVERLQAQLDAANVEAERATEAYNGARWELDQARERIRSNTRQIVTSQDQLDTARQILSRRLRNIYATPDPTLAQVIVTSGSVTNAVDTVQMLQRLGQRDGVVVDSIRTEIGQLQTARTQLVKDREAATVHVAEMDRQRKQVLGAIASKQRLLSGAKAELRRQIEAEQAREDELARQRAAAARQTQVAPTQAASSPATAPSSGQPTAPIGSGSGNAAAAQIALRYLGVPYVWGGASPSGFDCSGLASYAYAQIGKSVPHYTGAIWAAFPKVSSGDLQPGDLVFFRADLGHMGIYIGGGQYVHAPHTGDVVKISGLGERSDYQGAVRP